MATFISPQPKLQFFDSNGDPLVNAKLYTYAAGTSTLQTTYTDYVGGTPNANPVRTDARGECSVWLGTSRYKFALYTSTDSLIWTVDNIGGQAPATDVTFTNTGTGAITQTVQLKLQQTANAFDFIPAIYHAAILAGSTTVDVGGYLQEAIDAHKAVYLTNTGASLYLTSQTLDMPTRSALLSTGATIKAMANFGDIPIVKNANTSPASNAARDEGIIIDGIRFDGNKANNATGTQFSHCVDFRGVNGAILNFWGKNPKGDVCILQYSSANSAVGCSGIVGTIWAKDFARMGVAVVCADDCDLTVIAETGYYYALDIETDNNLCHVRNCIFNVIANGTGTLAEASSGAVAFDGAGGTGGGDVANISLTIQAKNVLGLGVYWRDVRRLSISGSIDTPATSGLYGVESGAFGSTVTFDVDVSGAGARGFTARETAGAIYNGRLGISTPTDIGVNIENARGGTLDLRITGGLQEALKLVATQDMTFPNAYIDGNVQSGVLITSSSTGNRFPNLTSTDASFGQGFNETSGNNNRATNARISGNAGGQVTLTGAASLVTLEPLFGSATWNPGSIADGDNLTTTITVTGAAVGDQVQVTFSLSLAGLALTGYVSAADTVTANLLNNTGSAVDLASGTLRAMTTAYSP